MIFLTRIIHKPDGKWGAAGTDSLPNSRHGRFVHPGLPHETMAIQTLMHEIYE